MHWDREIDIPMAGRREDGLRAGSRVQQQHREIGELLLTVDELEDTLRLLEERPELSGERQGESRTETIHLLEDRIRRERDRLAALERSGHIKYDEVERAIRLADAMG